MKEMIIYTTADGLAKIETTFDEDTVWLSKPQRGVQFRIWATGRTG